MANRKLVVEIVGDAKSLARAFRASEAAGKSFTRTVQLSDTQLRQSAEQNVAALAVQRRELQALAAAYGQMAAAATAGSAEAVAAAKLQRDALAKLDRQAGVATGGGVFAGLGSLKGVGVTAGVLALGTAFRTGFDEMQQASKAAAQTAAVLKSTGGAAHVTAGQIDELAESLLKTSGVDDEAIKGAENLLLTFTKVRNEIGEGNDVFTRATRLAVDLSRAFDQDLSTSAVLVGKALNDPVRGLTALQRVGVTFSDQQRKTIRSLTETGRTLEAQKVILAELQREVGGSAEAFGNTLPGKLSILHERIRNLEGDMVKLAAGPLIKLIDGLDRVAAAAQGAVDALDRLAHVKIPPIKVPFTDTQVPGTGSTVGHVIGQGLHFSKFAAFPEIFATKAIVDAIKGGGDEAKKQVTKAFRDQADELFDTIGGLPDLPQPDFKAALQRAGFNAANLTPANLRQARISTEQRNKFFDAAVGRAQDRVQDITSLQGQLAALAKIQGLLQKRLDATKDVTRRLTLEGRLLENQRAQQAVRERLAGEFAASLELGLSKAQATGGLKDDLAALQAINRNIQEQISQAGRTVDLETKLFENEQRIRETREEQRNRQQFRALGLGPTGDALVPLKAGLARQLGQVTAAIDGTFLDTARTNKTLAAIRKLVLDPFTKVSVEVRSTIKQMLDDFDSQLKDHTFRKRPPVDTQDLFAALGFPRDALRLAQSRLAQPQFLSPSFAAPQIAAAGGTFVVHTTVELDKQKVGSSLTKVDQKRRERNPLQRRG